MAFEIAIINGSIGFAFLMYLLFDKAENPYIKSIFLGWLNLSPMFIFYALSKIEEVEASIGNFFTYIMWAYAVWLMALLIFQLYTYFFGIGETIFGHKK